MTNELKTLKKSGQYAGAVVLAASGLLLGLLGYFAWTTVYSSDDYWYSTFWDNGLWAYLELMVYHYQEFNGRVLVHVLAHIVLELGQWAFVLMCCGLCVAACLAAVRGAGLEKEKLPVMLCLFLTGIFCMPLQIFNQGVMWISASCNYLFPSVLACLMAAALERQSRWSVLLAFLCGATTEQVGLAAVAMALVYTLDRALRREKLVNCVSSIAAAALGVVSIFLSPATAGRAERRVHLDSLEMILETFRKAIVQEAELLTLNPAPVIVMLAVLILGAVVLRKAKGWKWPAVCALVGSAALILGSIGSDVVCVWGYVLGFVALGVLSVGMMAGGERYVGALTLTGLVCAAVMLPTNTVEPRVMLPVYLLVMTAGCILAVRLLGSEAIPAAAGLIVSFAVSVPAIGGYWSNYQLDQVNKRYAELDREQEEIRYCMDYDMDYTWIKADFDPYFRMKYLQSIGLPENSKVRFLSRYDEQTQICIGEIILFRLPIHTQSGEVLFPLREMVETLGGTVDWSSTSKTLTLDGRTLELELLDDASMVFRAEDGQEGIIPWGMKAGESYCGLALFTEGFGLTVREEPEQKLYMIEK